MMDRKDILLLINLLVVLALGTVFLYQNRSEEAAFILNKRVFEEFRAQQDLGKKLDQLKENNQRELDSLAAVAQEHEHVREVYEQTKSRYALAEQALSEQYTADLWQQINRYVAEFGEQHGYAFIFGATGDGNLMYGGEARDVTDQIIEYINHRYEGHE